MKYHPPETKQLTPEQRKLYLKIQAEENAKEKRYASDPVLLKQAEAYHRELERMVEERAQPKFLLPASKVNQSVASGHHAIDASVEYSDILDPDSASKGFNQSVRVHTRNKKASIAVHAALVASKNNKKF